MLSFIVIISPLFLFPEIVTHSFFGYCIFSQSPLNRRFPYNFYRFFFIFLYLIVLLRTWFDFYSFFIILFYTGFSIILSLSSSFAMLTTIGLNRPQTLIWANWKDCCLEKIRGSWHFLFATFPSGGLGKAWFFVNVVSNRSTLAVLDTQQRDADMKMWVIHKKKLGRN